MDELTNPGSLQKPKQSKRMRKESVTIRLDSDVIDYFKALAEQTGLPYQSLINYVLKEYKNTGREPTANWKL